MGRSRGGGGGKGVQTPLKNHKNTGFLSNTGPDPRPRKSLCYQSSIKCWASFGKSANRHLKMTFRWRADDGSLLIVFETSLPSSAQAVRGGGSVQIKYKIKQQGLVLRETHGNVADSAVA